MRHLSQKERESMLRVGKLNVRFYGLLNRPAYDQPLWERLFTALVYFFMGIVEVFGGLTGIYFSRVIVWLGGWHAILTCDIRRWIGIKRDPELSQRIIDPRHRMAALDAIAASQAAARARR